MDLESQLRLKQDVPEVGEFLSSISGSLVHRDTDSKGLYWAAIPSASSTSRPFIARIAWTAYPHAAPSVLFADEVGGATTDPESWPAAPGYRAPNDICKPFTAEGQALHSEWRTGPHAWRSAGNPFLHVVETICGDLARADGRRAA
ncbi:hypothetical protein E1293_07995 [Actinomadura darangshiensis]|uniref:Uncharacterized protein n=1 Tax=Actinomadura darangshiensis TaxID=705336 RepID=A0A4V2YWZ1_9ACTN|nr:hypothetical protein [Actinomadura darangshiensis]TDD87337.1 hypothetical protein E1293_07995 [Actinomadura darangshiensis]